jgi:hypothetical protein
MAKAKVHTTQTVKSESPVKSDTFLGLWLELGLPQQKSKQIHLDEHGIWQLALNVAMFQNVHFRR